MSGGHGGASRCHQATARTGPLPPVGTWGSEVPLSRSRSLVAAFIIAIVVSCLAPLGSSVAGVPVGVQLCSLAAPDELAPFCLDGVVLPSPAPAAKVSGGSYVDAILSTEGLLAYWRFGDRRSVTAR